MAYTPDAKTQAALAKSRSGGKLSSTEQALLKTHSQRMISGMAPVVNTGGGGPYDYNSGTSGGYANYNQNQPYATDLNTGMHQMNPNALAESYNNFIQTEQERRQQGLPPRQLPAQFTKLAQYNNPLGYNTSDPSAIYTPKTGSQGYQNLQAAGFMNPEGQIVSSSNPQQNPGTSTTPVTPTPTTVQTNQTAALPFNPSDALPSAPQTIHTPNGGIALGNSVAGIDEGKLLAEAELQKQLRQQTYTQQVSGRKSMLDELSGVLQKQQQGMMSDQMPGIYEDLNTRGLLRSSALGEKLGLEQSKLARQTSEQLALQGITDRNTAINDLGAIEDSYLGGRGSAMQRRFSLEDFDRQIAAGERLGANALPQVSQSSGKGSSALQGGLGGATIGASVGGPYGAAAGGAIGALAGGKLGSK